jgi:hypothetical protein
MSITAISQVRDGSTTLVTAESDLADTIYYHWYSDGSYLGFSTSPTRSFLLIPGDQAHVDVVDTNDPDFDPLADPPTGYPPSRALEWVRSTDPIVASYRIEQQANGGSWTAIGTVAHDPSKWLYTFLATDLSDLTTYAWRIVPVSNAGNDGTAISVTAELHHLVFSVHPQGHIHGGRVMLVNTRADGLRLEVSGGSTEAGPMRWSGTAPGVIVQAVGARNGTGTGYLVCGPGPALAWRAPGSDTTGAFQDCSANGTFIVEDGEDESKYVKVQVYTDYMPESMEFAVTVRDRFGSGLAGTDISAANATAGIVESFHLALKNYTPLTINTARLWIDPAVTGIAVSVDNATWVTPTSEVHADVLAWATILTGATKDVYVRRTIAAAAASAPSVLNHLEFSWLGY